MAVDAEHQMVGRPLVLRASPKERASADVRRERRPRRRFSRLSIPILAVNLSALFILGVGLFYLDDYEKGLLVADIESMRSQGQIVAGAIGETAIDGTTSDQQTLRPQLARQLIRRLVDPMHARARLFTPEGVLVADSRKLRAPGGVVQIVELPPPSVVSGFNQLIFEIYDWLINLLPRYSRLPRYFETVTQHADDYIEVRHALRGESKGMVRRTDDAGLVISVAVPVQRYRQVLGALMLSHSGSEIDRAVRSVRLDIMKVFGIVFGATIILSLYIAGSIARPVRRLAAAADRVRRGQGRLMQPIPDFTSRGDEIGDLSAALREMTEAMWNRMDAIERFAADVAHEIKNPLTSMRSAVETVSRIEDPAQQRKLITIIQDDIQRLDRLISDISDASRVDAELSREEMGPVDIGRMLAALVEVQSVTGNANTPRLRLAALGGGALEVLGAESRLVQVFRNLLSNAVSFSPPGGTIALQAFRDGGTVQVEITDEGPGIPEEKREAIFDRFYSERPAGEKFGTHSGLGLSISKQIIDAHGGTVTAENCRDEAGEVIGARFIVRLPIE